LPPYRVPTHIYSDEAEEGHTVDHYNNLIKGVKSFIELRHICLYVEEVGLLDEIMAYNIKSTTLQKVGRFNRYQLSIPGLAENRPSVMLGDQVYIDFVKEEQQDRKYSFAGVVHEVKRDYAVIDMHPSFTQKSARLSTCYS